MNSWRERRASSINEEELLARLYLNLKGPKKKRNNWVEIAEDCQNLTSYYGSARKTAEKLSVSYELVRSLLKLYSLPNEVKNLIIDNKILFDVGQRIARIPDKKKQIEVAIAIAGLPSHTAREILQYAKKFPESSIADFKTRVIEGKNRVEKIRMVVTFLSQSNYDYIIKKCTEFPIQSLTISKFISSIIEEWISRKKRLDTK
jgi:hypothetical protein